MDIKLKKHPETGLLVPEIWENINGHNDMYDISNYGRIRSYHKRGCKPGRVSNPKILRPGNHNSGYHNIVLRYKGNAKSELIHRIVGTYFIPNPKNKPCINHLDGDKQNNFYLNLEWCTYSENEIHSRDIGLRDDKGSENPMAKLTEPEVIKIRELYKTGNYTQREIARIVDANYKNVHLIVNRKTWKHI